MDLPVLRGSPDRRDPGVLLETKAGTDLRDLPVHPVLPELPGSLWVMTPPLWLPSWDREPRARARALTH